MHGLVQPNAELRCWFWIGFAGQEIAIPALSGFAQGKIATPNLSYGMEVTPSTSWLVCLQVKFHPRNADRNPEWAIDSIQTVGATMIPSIRQMKWRWFDHFSDWSSTEIFIIRDRDYIIKWAHPLWFHDRVGWANNPCETRYIFQYESLIWIHIRWLHHLVSKPILILPLQR